MPSSQAHMPCLPTWPRSHPPGSLFPVSRPGELADERNRPCPCARGCCPPCDMEPHASWRHRPHGRRRRRSARGRGAPASRNARFPAGRRMAARHRLGCRRGCLLQLPHGGLPARGTLLHVPGRPRHRTIPDHPGKRAGAAATAQPRQGARIAGAGSGPDGHLACGPARGAWPRGGVRRAHGPQHRHLLGDRRQGGPLCVRGRLPGRCHGR